MLDEMTNIKASEVLKELEKYTEDLPHYSPDEVAEALEMAIKALEQQPSEDAVSREAVLELAKKGIIVSNDNYKCVVNAIKSLPSVTPRTNLAETSQDCISREYIEPIIEELENICFNGDEYILSLLSNIKNAPPVTPQRPKGKWIKIQSGDEDFPESIVCSRCKNENSHLDFDEHSVPIGKIFVTSKYCPNCGAEMIGGEEDGNSN